MVTVGAGVLVAGAVVRTFVGAGEGTWVGAIVTYGGRETSGDAQLEPNHGLMFNF